MPLTDAFDAMLGEMNLGARPAVAHRAGLRFTSAFQPIFSLSHGRVVGHEALLRASDAAGTPLPPAQVFATGGDFAELMWRDRLASLVHLSNYLGSSAPDQWLFLNVHPDVLAHGLGDRADGFVERASGHFKVPPQRIVIEVTEESSHTDADFESAVRHARDAGCLIALDDFGAGHSNFDRVFRWRPEIVKLDRSLLARAAADRSIRRIVVQMVSLLHECGALVLMEGVETAEEADLALEADADLAQGYLFGPPQPALGTSPTASSALDGAWQRFDQRWRTDKHVYRDRVAPYLDAIGLASAMLAAGTSLDEACAAFLSLPSADLCFLLGADGRQVGANLWGAAAAAQQRPRGLRPLQEAEGARWTRRPYFRRAVDTVGKVQITRPYRTLLGGVLCVTVSCAFVTTGASGQTEVQVVCGDLRWDHSAP